VRADNEHLPEQDSSDLGSELDQFSLSTVRYCP
jgi:hypothetical protein